LILKIANLLKILYVKLVKINDTPQKIAIGFALGVFAGIMPGIGPISALFLAAIFRVNKISALLGSVISNTWLSIVVFLLSVKIGAAVTGLDWKLVNDEWAAFLKAFQWDNLFKLSIYKMIFPVIIGYFIISVIIGIIAYLIALFVHKKIKHNYRHAGS
jgi:uncharacterized protein (DUF2062 family)